MAITDELREYAKSSCDVMYSAYQVILAIADRIDAENERECHEQYVCGAEHGIGASIEASMIQERGYIELPKDADGKVIHIGDAMEWVRYEDDDPTIVRKVSAVGAGVFFAWSDEQGRYAQYEAQAYRHHKQQTVEDVLTDLCEHVWESALLGSTWSDSPVESCITEYAAKLRLAESEES